MLMRLQEYAQLQHAEACKRRASRDDPDGASDDDRTEATPDPIQSPLKLACSPASPPASASGQPGSKGRSMGGVAGSGAQAVRSARLVLVELRERVPPAAAALLVPPLLDAGPPVLATCERDLPAQAPLLC